MARCPNKECSEHNKIVLSDFCRKCGTKSKRVACPYCSYEIIDTADKFCGNCGRPVQGVE